LLPWHALFEQVFVPALNVKLPDTSLVQFTCLDGSEIVVLLLTVALWQVAHPKPCLPCFPPSVLLLWHEVHVVAAPVQLAVPPAAVLEPDPWQ